MFFLFKFDYINKHLHLGKDLKHFKLIYTDPCNFHAKRALMSQPSIFEKSKSISLHYEAHGIERKRLWPFPLIIDVDSQSADTSSEISSVISKNDQWIMKTH